MVSERGITASISGITDWRWLGEDAIKPWLYRSWIFPRVPDFQYKAGRVLDLYHRISDGKPLDDNDFVIGTDEKTSIQARRRIHVTIPPKPGHAIKVEAEYERMGALASSNIAIIGQTNWFHRFRRYPTVFLYRDVP